MSEIKKTDYCSCCKVKNVSLMKYATNKNRTVQYHYCRKCTREKMLLYYHTAAGGKNMRDSSYRSIEKHRIKQNARVRVYQRLKRGVLKKPKTCEECGLVGYVQAHHIDYEKDIIEWICSDCHTFRHKNTATKFA